MKIELVDIDNALKYYQINDINYKNKCYKCIEDINRYIKSHSCKYI